MDFSHRSKETEINETIYREMVLKPVFLPWAQKQKVSERYTFKQDSEPTIAF